MSVTGTHLLSCQIGRGMRQGAHDVITRTLASALAECADSSKMPEGYAITTDKSEGGLMLHLDPAYMHGPRRAADVSQVGGSFNALVEDEEEGLEAELDNTVGDDERDNSESQGSQQHSKRPRGGWRVKKAARDAELRIAARQRADEEAAEVQADLRFERYIVSPELNPTAARANIETVDLKITSPTSATYIAKAAKVTGHAAALSEATKNKHYLKHYADKANVAPLVIETFGHMEPESEATLMRLTMLAAGLPKNTDLKTLHKVAAQGADGGDAAIALKHARKCLSRVRDSLSVALWRTNAVALDKKLRSLHETSPLSLAFPLAWEGPVYPKGVHNSYSDAIASNAFFRLDDNNREAGFRLEALPQLAASESEAVTCD